MSKRITELPLATQLNTEDQFIFYSNSAKETQRVNAGISLNVIANNLPSVLKATTNASLGIANAALADAKAAEALANAATAQASAEGAQTSADGKAKVYYQSSAPTGGVYNAGDIWYDTDDSYKLYVRTGGAWVASFGPMLKLDGNNNISGLLKADGTDKSFVLVAENFQIWNGVSPEVPFEVVEDPLDPPNQVVRIRNAQIQKVDAGKLTAGFISSQVFELANTNAYIQSGSFIETWTTGRVFRQKSLNKAIPSDQLQCKVEQADGTFLVYDCLSNHTSSGASFPGVGGLWALTDPQPSSQSIGFRINGNGQAEFNGVKVRGNIIANTGYFGSGSDTIQIGADGGGGANGLTLGNKGYIKSTGLTYSGSNFTGSTSGFFLGNTQGYDQTSVYQFFIGNPSGNYLKWNGTDLTLKGNLIGGSTVGTSGEGTFGLTINSSIGLRYYDNNGVLTITGGTNNWINSGAGQLDLQGKDFGGANAGGAAQLIGGKGANGKVFLRTWNGDANNYYDCVTASTNGSVGINNSSPSSSYKLDVSGDGRFTGELISSNITASISSYTVGLWDGGNNIRFKYDDGLYAKIDASDPILIVSPKLNLAASEILGEFTFGTTDYAGGVKTGTIDWDANGNNVTGQGVAIYRKGIVGADGTKVTFVIDTSGNATFAGTLSAPNGTIGGFTIDGKLYIQKTTLTDANDGVYLATDGIALGANSVFKVTSAGALTAASATITGAITATSGFIGTAANGFSINSSYIAKGKVSLTDSNSGVYIGADGIALGASSVFKVTNTGVLTATSANITGAITATSGSFTGTVTATSGSFTGTITSTLGTIGGFTIGPTSLTAGTGSSAIGMATSGGYAFFAGNATPASAPFRVAPTGELTATSVTVTGSVTSTSGNIAGTTTVGNGGTSAVTIGGAINSSGIISSAALSNKLDTAAGTILGQFALTGSGALQIGTFSSGASGDIRITPNGITARNSSGTTTFSLDGTTGNAVFAGQLSGASGTFSGNISGASGTFQGAISSNSVTATGGNIGGFTIGATSLTAGTGSSAIGMATSGGYAFFAGNATPASAPFHVTDAGYVKSTNGNIGGFGVSANSLTFGSGGNTVGIDSGGTNPAFYAGSATPGSAPFRVSTSGVLVATSATITGAITATSGSFTGSITAGSGSVGGWTIAAGKISSGNIDIDSANARIQAGPSASNYVRISSDGIIGVDSVLGQTFNLPTNGGRPTFSSGEITLTKFVVSTQGVIQTSDTVGDGSGSGQGIRINNTGIKGFKSGNANPTFHLDASNGDVTFGLTSGNYLQYTSSNGILGFKAGTGGVVTNIDNDGVTVGTSGSKRVFLGTFTTGIYTNPASLYFRNSSNTLMMGMYLNGENAPTLDMQVGTAYIYNGIYNVGKNWQHSFYSYTDNGDSYLTMDNAFGGARVQITSTSGAIVPRFSVQNTSNGTYSKLEGNSLFLQGNTLSGGTLYNDAGARLATSGDLLVGANLAASGVCYFYKIYDLDDTAYHCDPASTSNFNGLNVGGSSVLTSGSTISVNEVNSTGDVKTPTLRNNANNTYTPTLTSSSNGSHTLAFRFADDKLYILIDGTTEKYVNLI